MLVSLKSLTQFIETFFDKNTSDFSLIIEYYFSLRKAIIHCGIFYKGLCFNQKTSAGLAKVKADFLQLKKRKRPQLIGLIRNKNVGCFKFILPQNHDTWSGIIFLLWKKKWQVRRLSSIFAAFLCNFHCILAWCITIFRKAGSYSRNLLFSSSLKFILYNVFIGK